ncbi:MAG: PQQ-dependent sugar dehydrogenase, partial [Bacteroidetes bacterium]|nr:PQQ-dependent sugar dehydrogenase [Bacteroidota bacterium]
MQSTSVDTTTIITGLNIPWELIWGPDNFIWMTERFGRISRINPETGEQHILKVIDEVHQVSETGLLGMALHPDFFQNPYVFVVYTYLKNQEITVKVVRFSYSKGILIEPLAILDDIPGSFN